MRAKKIIKAIYFLLVTTILFMAIAVAQTWPTWTTKTPVENGDILQPGHLNELYDAVKPISDAISSIGTGTTKLITLDQTTSTVTIPTGVTFVYTDGSSKITFTNPTDHAVTDALVECPAGKVLTGLDGDGMSGGDGKIESFRCSTISIS